MVVLGGVAVSYERGTPVMLRWRIRVLLLIVPRIGHFGREKPKTPYRDSPNVKQLGCCVNAPDARSLKGERLVY